MNDVRFESGPWGARDPSYHRWLEVIFLCGLAGAFLVNALVALITPNDFTDLVDQSALAWTLNYSGAIWIAPAIFVHDVVLGLAVLSTIWLRRGLRLAILAWAGVWLLVVTLVKVTAL
jgi:hypothetical protein